MIQDTYRSRLAALGLGPADLRSLMLLPLVYVAWAQGSLSAKPRERLLHLAKDILELGPGALRALNGWLIERPSVHYMRRGLTTLRGLARAPDEPTIDPDDMQRLLAYGEDVAREAAKEVGQPWALTPAQRQARREVAQALGLDTGEPWEVVLHEVAEPLPKSALAPRLLPRPRRLRVPVRPVPRRLRAMARLASRAEKDKDREPLP